MAYLLQSLLTNSRRLFPKEHAVSHRDRRIDYEELDRLSNQVAHLLSDQGVRPGDRVGLYLQKSVEAIISIFGVLKAGAAYVPIDPQSPVKRASYIIKNCRMSFIVGSAELLPRIRDALTGSEGIRGVLLVDRTPEPAPPFSVPLFRWEAIAVLPFDEPPRVDCIEDDLAYILYTSGSTGEPKGVMITHRNALTFVEWGLETFRVSFEDRLSNHAPLHFDLSIFDIFVAIGAGATVILVPEGNVFPVELSRFISENRITIWYSVPSALILLLLYGNLPKYTMPALRAVLFAGEVFPVKYLRQLMKEWPQAGFYNLYGPTETNVCTYYPVEILGEDRTEPIPIGRACANTEVFALTESKRLISPGEVGELFVRGPSVMKGYWGFPEKSRAALAPSPLSSHLGDAAYRTGDRVTVDAEGNYHYLGRTDHMIKCRGYRVEAGEIEAALYSHPNVKEAAVVGIPDDQIGNRIRAFVVLNAPDVLTDKELVLYCAGRVPRYMIPDQIEFCESLPKTSTGKIDRLRLPPHRKEG